jgi:hypothetical protein
MTSLVLLTLASYTIPFFNQNNLFMMVTEKKSARFGRRLRVVAS